MIASAIYLDVHDEPSRRQPPAAVRKPESQKARKPSFVLPAFLPVDYVTNELAHQVSRANRLARATNDLRTLHDSDFHRVKREGGGREGVERRNPPLFCEFKSQPDNS